MIARWFALVLLMSCLVARPGWCDPTLVLLGTPRQGNPIFLTLDQVTEGTTGEVTWDNKTYELTPADHQGRMRTVLAVPVELKPGRYTLAVDLDNDHHLTHSVTVQERWFPTQHLTIPTATLASYDKPQNKADDQRIIEVLSEFDPAKHWHGNFSLPVQAPESTGFGDRRLYNGWKTGWHKGLDLAAANLAPIHAPADGVVLLTARGLVNGNTVVLGHGLGLGTVYLHMTRFIVQKGDSVHKGQVIGYVGGTGGFAPHLHWEARANGVPIDPHTLLDLPSTWR